MSKSDIRELDRAMVVSISGGGLGDCWASVNWCVAQRQRVLLYAKTTRGQDRRALVTEILSLLDTPQQVEISSEPGHKLTWKEVYQVPYVATRLKWSAIEGHVAYQFDGKSRSRLKNCPVEDERRFYQKLASASLFRLGKPKSLTESVTELMGCEMFVGVDSGFAHVACSVGLPTFIIRNGRTWNNIHVETFPGKAITSFPDMREFLDWRRSSSTS